MLVHQSSPSVQFTSQMVVDYFPYICYSTMETRIFCVMSEWAKTSQPSGWRLWSSIAWRYTV